MATQTFSNADAILKDLYVGPIVEQLNQKTYLLDKIERDSDSVDHTGRRAVVPIHASRNRGRGSFAAGGTLPTAGRQGYADAIIAIRYHGYGIEIEHALVTAATGNNSGAFLNALDAETKGVAIDMKKDINRQAFGDGTGLLGTCASASGAVVTMGSKQDVQYIQVGDVVDVLVKSTGATTAGVVTATVTARSVSSKTVTTSPAVGTAGSIDSTYGIYIAGNRNNESDGLRNIANTGRTLHSINSSTAGNEYWDGQLVDVGTSSTALTVAGEDQFIKLADKIGEAGQGNVTAFLTSRGIRTKLAAQYQSQKRMNDAKAVDIHGGYTAIMVNEYPVIPDDDCPKTEAFAIDSSGLTWFEQKGPGWMELNDSTIFHLKDGSTAGTKVAVFQAWWIWYAALGSKRPNSIGRLRYVTDDTAVSG